MVGLAAGRIEAVGRIVVVVRTAIAAVDFGADTAAGAAAAGSLHKGIGKAVGRSVAGSQEDSSPRKRWGCRLRSLLWLRVCSAEVADRMSRALDSAFRFHW